MHKELYAVCDFLTRFPDLDDRRPDSLLKSSQVDSSAPSHDTYHHFMFAWVQKTQPRLIVETGTDRGISAAHFAVGCPSAKVVSIDIRRECTAILDAFGFPNVETITANSVDVASRFDDQSIDLLLLDSLHTYDHVMKEIELYVPKMREGTVVFMDDIAQDAEMGRAWRDLAYPKRSLVGVHYPGFGVFGVPCAPS